VEVTGAGDRTSMDSVMLVLRQGAVINCRVCIAHDRAIHCLRLEVLRREGEGENYGNHAHYADPVQHLLKLLRAVKAEVGETPILCEGNPATVPSRVAPWPLLLNGQSVCPCCRSRNGSSEDSIVVALRRRKRDARILRRAIDVVVLSDDLPVEANQQQK
jgi:hypothetical protein